MDWEPLDLEMEVPAGVWDEFVREIEQWNRRTFGGKGRVWTELTDDEAPEALAYFGFQPFVRRVLCEGRPGLAMSFHLRPRRGERVDRSLSDVLAMGEEVRVKAERWAVTISDGPAVRFAVCHEMPRRLLRLTQDALARTRTAADAQVRRFTG